MIIYKATNKINGKVYVGKTNGTLKRRINRHLSWVKGGSKNLFHRAIRKYGPDNFTWEIIDNGLFIQLESYWIKKLNCKAPGGYNLTDGGEGRNGDSPSEKTRKKMSDSMSAVWANTQRWRKIRRKPRPQRFYTLKEAADITGLSTDTLFGLGKNGILIITKINSRVFRITENELIDLPWKLNNNFHDTVLNGAIETLLAGK